MSLENNNLTDNGMDALTNADLFRLAEQLNAIEPSAQMTPDLMMVSDVAAWGGSFPLLASLALIGFTTFSIAKVITIAISA